MMGVNNQSSKATITGRLVSVSQRASGVTPGALLQHASGEARFFWDDGQDKITFAAFGIAAELTGWGELRFEQIERQARDLFGSAVIVSTEQPLAAPRLFGGFAFRSDFVPDNTWSAFHPAQFVLPHYQLMDNGEETWLTINTVLPPEDDLDETILQLREALALRLEWLQDNPVAANNNKPRPIAASYPMQNAAWNKMIASATRSINADEMKKVVLARMSELRFDQSVDLGSVFDYLNDAYSDCYRFLFEPRPRHAFYGATPELLVKTKGKQLTTMSIAGTAPRSSDPEIDAQHSHALFSSPKERLEHDLVVRALEMRLGPLTDELSVPDEPDILLLRALQHLKTPIEGQLKEASGVLPVVELLHPTPALGGAPRDIAMRFIQQAEPMPRGWYAGPVGWIDSNLDGAFGVAIRSAVAQEDRVWLYAGAGIVGDSIPQNEWEETALKFTPMLRALGLSHVDELTALVGETV